MFSFFQSTIASVNRKSKDHAWKRLIYVIKEQEQNSYFNQILLLFDFYSGTNKITYKY